MGEFDTAAHEAVSKVQPLIEALVEAEKECQEALQHVQALGARLTEDRHALQGAVAALESDAGQAEQVLSGQVADATADLGRVADVVGAAAAEWEDVLGKEDEALVGAASLLPELGTRVKELAENAEAASQGVLEWATAVSQQLEEAVEAVEQVVSVGLSTMVADSRREAEATVARVVEFFEKDCAELLNTKEGEWKEKVGQLHPLLEHAFESIATHEREVAAYTAEKWGHLLDAQLDSTGTEAHKLGEALSSLSQAARNYEGELQSASDLVRDHQQQAGESAAKLEQGLFEVRGRWATSGITG